ncbi:hypothetical protein [Aureliella helgolandensis]|uniref:Uncharacterized protein n=1 Tax=Aureliella helgolandensis TaxID=2527968 RepID=A0A518GCL9_9BACT|nr:hypothetical protein [Aureliella helgolandensis]QDV26345.1 hypothetical protein Q31a_47180 [Aureliella helgolandensis]
MTRALGFEGVSVAGTTEEMPGNAPEGQFFFDATTGQWMVWDDSADGSAEEPGGWRLSAGIVCEELTFEETAGAGTYTGSVPLPAGATIHDILVNGVALWNASGAVTLKVGDAADDDGFFTGVNLKATDLLAGESLSFALAGGKAGAYIANSQVTPRYSPAARTINAIVTAAGTAGTAGRTRVTKQMGGGAEGASANAQAAPGGAQASSPVSPPQGQPGGGQYMQQPLPRYQATESDDLELVDRYEKMADQFAELGERYSKLNDVNADIMKKYGEVRSAVVELEKRECDKDRELQIKDLYQKYPHFVEVDSELDRCLYSRGSELTQSQFSSHLESVERYAQKSSPVTRMIPNGSSEKPDAGQDAAEVSAMVVDRYTQYERQGVYKTYDELEAEVRKELSGSPS